LLLLLLFACLAGATMQGVELQSLSVYFDCGATPLEPSQPWPSLPTASWDALLLPVNHLPEGYHHGPLLFSMRSTSPSKGLPGSSSSLGSTHSHPHSRSSSPSRQLLVTSSGAAPFEAPHPGSPRRQGLAGLLPSPAATARQQHQYLLAPVDGTLTYTRRGAKSRHTERDAHQEVHLALRSINLRLHQQQYVSAQKLLQEFDRYAASAPHRHLRPNCRPSPGGVHLSGADAVGWGDPAPNRCLQLHPHCACVTVICCIISTSWARGQASVSLMLASGWPAVVVVLNPTQYSICSRVSWQLHPC
jgi:hypothetical protein